LHQFYRRLFASPEARVNGTAIANRAGTAVTIAPAVAPVFAPFLIFSKTFFLAIPTIPPATPPLIRQLMRLDNGKYNYCYHKNIGSSADNGQDAPKKVRAPLPTALKPSTTAWSLLVALVLSWIF